MHRGACCNPGGLLETPKEIEHRRRDTHQDKEHQCHDFTRMGSLPTRWRTVIECRCCKKRLTTFISEEMLKQGKTYLSKNQTLVTNIGERAYSTSGEGTPKPEPDLRSNSDEGDLRVWLHCKHSTGSRKLIFSPDTDIYHIGLTICRTMPSTTIHIQLSKSILNDSKFLHLNVYWKH